MSLPKFVKWSENEQIVYIHNIGAHGNGLGKSGHSLGKFRGLG
jgi:hypothetical protein